MAANPDRGEMTINLGPNSLHLVCRRKQRRTLIRSLGCEPFTWFQESRGKDEFLNQFIFHTCQVYHKGTTPTQIDDMLDEYDGDSDILVKEMLYCYARGHTGEDARKMIKILDEVFTEEKKDKDGLGPTVAVTDSLDTMTHSL